MTTNQQLIADSAVKLLTFAKQQLPSAEGKEMTDYILSELGKVADETPVTVAEGVDSGFDLCTAICVEAKALHVAQLFTDLKKAAEDGEKGNITAVIGDAFPVIHDFSVIKKQGK